MQEYKGKIKAILPFGLIIKLIDHEDINKEGFVFEKDITSEFVSDLNLYFEVDQIINVKKAEKTNGLRENYKLVNLTNQIFGPLHKEDPLFKALINQIEKI